MKLKLFLLFLLLAGVSFAADADRKGWVGGPDKSWYTDYDKALEAAKKENKKVYVLRTGSDWCGWCIKLKKDVFATREFKNFAKKNLILLYLDSPRKKRMPAEQKSYNSQIASQLKMGGGVPSAVILDADGKEVARRSGYMKLKPYMSFLKSAVKK